MAWGAASWALRDIHLHARHRAAKHRDPGRLFSEGQALKVRGWCLALRMASLAQLGIPAPTVYNADRYLVGT